MNKNVKKGDKRKEKKKAKKKVEKVEEIKKKTVEIDVTDILELAKKIVTEGYGGIGASDVEYVGEIESLKFVIPDMTEEGKCNNICPPEPEGIDNEGGCGETGGSCICGEKEGHEGDCICRLCGHEF